MKFRTLLATTFVSAALATSASAFSLSSFEYSFSLTDTVPDPDVTISGILEFDSNEAGWQTPDKVAVTGNTAIPDGGDPANYGVGDYDTGTATGQGFLFDTVGDITDSDYTVSREDGVLRFTLEFDSGVTSRYLVECSYFNDASDCANNIFAPRERTQLVAEFSAIPSDSSKVPPVPLPAGLPLMFVGLAGLAGLRARRKAA